MSLPAASVILCSHNRAEQLTQALPQLFALRYPGTWEIIVVDNASTDATTAVAQRLAVQAPVPVRVITEPRLGLSAARNAGIQAAQGEVLAFTDDDAQPEPGWLAGLAEALRPEAVLAVGGPVQAAFASPPPLWLSAHFLPYLALWDLGPEPLRLSYNEYPRGINMAFKRQAFTLAGEFSLYLGRKGHQLLSCEEIEFCLRLERLGGEIWYTPAARVAHRIDPVRISPQWLQARFAAQGASEAILNQLHAGWAGVWQGRRLYPRVLRLLHTELRGPGRELLLTCLHHSQRGYWRRLPRALWVPRLRDRRFTAWQVPT